VNLDPRFVSPHALAATAFRLRELGIFVALAATILIFSVRADNFLTVGNWQNIATDVAMVAVVAVGQTMVVLTRNIDLSVGSIVGLSAYIAADTLADHQGTPIIVIALLAMAVGLACGIFNGLLVVVGRIPAIIATLATLAIYRGLAFEATGGGGDNISAFQLPDNFLDLSARKPLGVPILAWIAIEVAIMGAATLRWAPWGRDI
jgi:rhamnose transport system permease protein